ncbi:hypothetical protein WKI65_37595 [Streptomyces sp. MS1.AVA.3]|uniref:hypothetical protein n=1 Tax=Streptomyces decoyicus TaxID=249567 RepID=UPI0030C3F348
MPHSTRRSLAARRRAYTGEDRTAAALGMPRSANSIGLDSCTPAQRRLRALWALGVFNDGVLQAWPGEWALYGITAYNIVVSPQHDHLAIITSTPHNVVCWLTPNGNDTPGNNLPGLRLERQIADTYLLRHLPTGTTMSVTTQPDSQLAPRDNPALRDDRLWGIDKPLTEYERATFEELPPMAPATETLLAGLTVRLCLRDPNREWAIGTWWRDPLKRPRERARFSTRRLWGSGSRWELEWRSYPYPDDLAQAMTDPLAGIPGAKAQRVRRGWDIHLDDGILALRP